MYIHKHAVYKKKLTPSAMLAIAKIVDGEISDSLRFSEASSSA